MAFCTECGHQLADGAKFCFECGAKVNGTSTSGVEQRKTVYDGEIHKCPNCGEMLSSFVTNCPSCGYELRSVKTNSPVEALAKKVEQASSLDEKIELITNFYIPNTKEDICDFFILAVSNLEDKWYDTDDAWRAKLEQAYHKARLSFGNTPEFEYLEKLYTKTRKVMIFRDKSISALFRRNKVAFITVLLVIIGLIMLTIGIVIMASGSEDIKFVGSLLLLFSFPCFCLAVSELVEDGKKKTKSNKKKISQNSNSTTLPIGKDTADFLGRNYDDMTEFLNARGFNNIVTKPEKKEFWSFEGAIKGISIAGITEFSEDDEFDVDSKIIIRYFSKNC